MGMGKEPGEEAIEEVLGTAVAAVVKGVYAVDLREVRRGVLGWDLGEAGCAWLKYDDGSGGGCCEVVAITVPLGKFGNVTVDTTRDCEELIGCGVLETREVFVLVLAHVEQARARPFLVPVGEESRTVRLRLVVA